MRGIAAIVGSGDDNRVAPGIAEVLRGHVTDPALLAGFPCTGSRERYTRHLIHAGAGFSVLALVWLPGQQSSVHSHNAWCALGVQQGELVETSYRPPALRVRGRRRLRVGMTSHGAAGDTACHRIANVGTEAAISIHVYGIDFDRLGQSLNRVWAE